VAPAADIVATYRASRGLLGQAFGAVPTPPRALPQHLLLAVRALPQRLLPAVPQPAAAAEAAPGLAGTAGATMSTCSSSSSSSTAGSRRSTEAAAVLTLPLLTELWMKQLVTVSGG
jgi:hypothetical protein